MIAETYLLGLFLKSSKVQVFLVEDPLEGRYGLFLEHHRAPGLKGLREGSLYVNRQGGVYPFPGLQDETVLGKGIYVLSFNLWFCNTACDELRADCRTHGNPSCLTTSWGTVSHLCKY